MFGNRRGIIFTYDAIMALSLLSIFIFGLFIYYYNESSENIYAYIKEKKNNLLAHDIITTLHEIKFSSLPSTYQNEISSTCNIDKEVLYNKSIDEIIVLLWNKNNYTLIKNLIDYLYPNLTKYFYINITLSTSTKEFIVYSTSNTSSEYISKAYTFVTGYEETKEPLGYVAKAFATKIKKNTTLVFPISPEGAGNEGGWLTITKKFYYEQYPENLSSAIFYISIHKGRSSSDLNAVSINGVNIKDDIVWLWNELAATGRAMFGYVDLKPHIHHGWNTLTLRFKNPQYNAHVHPGSRIEITYSDDSFYEEKKNVEKYVYYEDVLSNETLNRKTGVWATMEYYIPLNSHINNVTFHLSLRDIEDVGWWWSWEDWQWYNWDVRVYVNGNLIDEIIHPSKNMDLYYDLTPVSQQGTNYIVVYANTYGDDFTGDGYTEIYSDPENDPYGSTYVFLNYTYNETSLYYGKIDITISNLLGGNKENPKTYTINFNDNTLLSTFLHVAQLFSYTIDVDVWSSAIPTTRVFSSHLPRGIPSTIYIDPVNFDVSVDNYIRMEDSCSGCDYLPESSFEYTILIPSHVGYGNVLPSKEEAINDAIQRLRAVLGGYINATEIKNETASIGNIPYLHGPVRLEVTVW